MAEIVAVDAVWTQTKHLSIRDLGRRGRRRTHHYDVRLRRNGRRLGTIQWPQRFLGYSFMPNSGKDTINAKYIVEAMDVAKWLTEKWSKEHPRKPKRKYAFSTMRLRRLRALLEKPDGGGLDKRYAPMVK